MFCNIAGHFAALASILQFVLQPFGHLCTFYSCKTNCSVTWLVIQLWMLPSSCFSAEKHNVVHLLNQCSFAPLDSSKYLSDREGRYLLLPLRISSAHLGMVRESRVSLGWCLLFQRYYRAVYDCGKNRPQRGLLKVIKKFGGNKFSEIAVWSSI